MPMEVGEDVWFVWAKTRTMAKDHGMNSVHTSEEAAQAEADERNREAALLRDERAERIGLGKPLFIEHVVTANMAFSVGSWKVKS